MIAPAPSLLHPTAPADLTARIRGCWLGKSIGGTLGLPCEGATERLHFTFYNPVPTIAPPNDDLELQLVWLHLIETTNHTLTQSDFAEAWLKHIHYMWDEYGRTRWNLRRGVPLRSVGTFENPFHAGMGSPIRSEIWACLFPGDEESAAYYAALDASLDHGTEGIAGEVLFAAMQSGVADEKSFEEALAIAMRFLPQGCETLAAVNLMIQSHRSGLPEWNARERLLTAHGSDNFTHAPLNVALTLWALLYGAGDFEKSILLAVNAGYDTDCTAATVGATLGLADPESIPARWADPIGDGIFIGAGIQGIDAPRTLSELTDRTAELIGKLESKSWDNSVWKNSAPPVELARLPGTIPLQPLDGSEAVWWANGELPKAVKKAGGAMLSWEVESAAPRQIFCLARHGASLFLDGKPLLKCPAGLPFVPATHRSPKGSGVHLTVSPGIHDLRIELLSSDENQEASLLLSYPNHHLAPWTAEELPWEASLP